MASELSFFPQDNHLKVLITGAYRQSDFKDYPKSIAEECKKLGYKKVLVDALHIERNNIPSMERYAMREEIARVLGHKIKLAILWPAEGINKFAETVATNRGANMIVLSNEESAMKWLGI